MPGGVHSHAANKKPAIIKTKSFYFLALALKNLPLGTAYAIWTGIGTIGTVIFGIILFKEPVTVTRLACIALIVSGIIGLKMLTH